MAGSWFFDGTDDVVTITHQASHATPSTAVTLAGWIRPGTAGEAANEWPLIHKTWTAAQQPYLAYGISRITNRTTFSGVASIGGVWTKTAGDTIPALDAWYFFAVTWQSGSPLQLRMWDAAGTLVTDVSTTNQTGSLAYDTDPEPVVFGRNAPANRWWHGHMAYVGAHNTLLSDTDLGTWRTTGVPPVTPSSFFVPFDSASAVDTAQSGTVNVVGAVHDAGQSPPVTSGQSEPIDAAAETDAAQTVGVSQTFPEPRIVVGIGFQ